MKGRFESRWKLVFLARVVRHEHLLILRFTRVTRAIRIAILFGHFGHDGTHVRQNIRTVDGRTSIQVRIELSTNFAIFVKTLEVMQLCFNFQWHILVRAVIVVRLHDVVIADALRVILAGGSFAHRVVRFEVIQRRRGRRRSRRAVNRQSRNALALDVIIVVIVIVFRANTTTAKEGGGNQDKFRRFAFPVLLLLLFV